MASFLSTPSPCPVGLCAFPLDQSRSPYFIPILSPGRSRRPHMVRGLVCWMSERYSNNSDCRNGDTHPPPPALFLFRKRHSPKQSHLSMFTDRRSVGFLRDHSSEPEMTYRCDLVLSLFLLLSMPVPPAPGHTSVLPFFKTVPPAASSRAPRVLQFWYLKALLYSRKMPQGHQL